MTNNRLKRLLADRQPAWGVWSALGSAAVVEALVQLEVDWLLLDTEHGVSSYEDCMPLLQALSASRSTPVVRVPSSDPVAARRVLDMGAQGVLVPYVHSAAEVEHVVSACRYPPTGTRGIGPLRASDYYLRFAEYYRQANDEVLVLVQIETLEALENLPEILAVPGLDAIFIGPADLSAALGEFPRTDGPAMADAVGMILRTAQAAGKPVGYYCSSGKEARRRAEEGFLMVNVALDVGLVTMGLRRELKAAKGEG